MIVQTSMRDLFDSWNLAIIIRSFIIEDLDLFVMSLTLKMNANLPKLGGNVMKLEQTFDRGSNFL